MRLAAKNNIPDGWQEGLLAAALTGVPAAVLWASVPASRGSAGAVLVAGVAAGALLLMATLTFYLRWLANPRPHQGWVAAAMMLLASQMMISSGLRLIEADSWSGAAWSVTRVDLLVTAAALVLVTLGARGVRAPDPLLLGLGLGTAFGALQVAELLGSLPAPPAGILAVLMLLTIVGGHVWIATMMGRDRALRPWVRMRLVAVVCLIGAVHITLANVLDGWVSDLATIVALAAAASLWTSATFVLLHETLRDQRQRSAGLEDTLLELETNWRGSREQLHEIRSTLAGAASACRLLNDHTLDAATHTKLERSIRTELERLVRLVSGQAPAAPEPVDVDATLDVLLASHRARGREISWEPNGATVQARPDDVAEALNILIDNAATHGGTVSRIAVTQGDDLVEIAVSDEGPGIPPESREQIFDWGVRGSQSPGQGIGLNLARRLVSEQGGSLRLAEPSTRGASFVIRLPAARRSEEKHVVDS